MSGIQRAEEGKVSSNNSKALVVFCTSPQGLMDNVYMLTTSFGKLGILNFL